MEIKYTNTVEDIEFLIRYIQYKYYGYATYKYVFSLVGVVSGIYYSIEYNAIYPLFTNSIIMTTLTFLYLKKNESRDVTKLSKRIAMRLFKKDEYFKSEKTLSVDNKSINIKYSNGVLKIKLNIFIKLHVLDEYVIIYPIGSHGYKNKIIIPNKFFTSEKEKELFIEELKLKIKNVHNKNNHA